MSSDLDTLRRAVGEVIRGKDRAVELALTCVLATGHLLIQDVPGVGKTTLANALANALGGTFRRVQFTADLLPADILGTPVLEPGTATFTFRPGPVFTHVLLADELNRATPRCQSALLEAMEEGSVTIDGETRALPDPFLVVATQNPMDFEGTYPLPESQLDRFLMRISLGYPDRETERSVLRDGGRQRQIPSKGLDLDAIRRLRAAAEQVALSPEIEDYLLDLVRRSRSDARMIRGVSTRGGQALYRAVQAYALLQGRSFAIPEDLRRLAVPVLGHRVLPRSDGGPGGMGGPKSVAALLDELRAPG
ncbi:MAG: MoxR family ATPase [Deltaproteobacteria bacterium]|nr:MAG: MoxR family ATPase [Deltaproteobacteria bacterium]